ncbi:cytochrome P450 [Allosphingosinicella deserti]|uniref:Cytochrome P450 n=1 Tax=Allosphingosinicella deserti TaxID=2116704 RepID=A0A2P7QRV8_9SPHN|nr:cytochrome P450 [Sphingomonas deserti]PSJ40713.1 cytochrome P450 [Sphingomonas deserti]
MTVAWTVPEHAQSLKEQIDSLPIGELDVARPDYFELGVAEHGLQRLRCEAPVHHCADGLYGAYWSITRHKDVEAIELDHETFSSDHFNGGITIASHPDEPQFFPAFISMDPPRHGEQRKAVAPAFSLERMNSLGDQVRLWCAEILDDLPVGAPFDWVDRVSIGLTARTLALLLGVPQARARDLIRWSEAAVALPGHPLFPTIETKLAALQECFAMFDAIWEERIRNPAGGDLVSLLASRPETRTMAKAEFHGNILLLLVGGNDTTRNSISGSVVAFDRFPEELEKLRAESELVRNLAPEIFRWQTPLAHMRRTATRDVDFKGHRIRKGDKVVLWYLSANRDEAMFADGDAFMIDRQNARRQLALGAGIHRCIGARAAELQVRILWEEILKRFRRIDVTAPPKRTASCFIHGYQELVVTIPERM